ncbi:hypothetical protein BDEG_20083 [Batrachochytrium dendrobatidis JEL423]|uniref:Uncharacterized protein n=1 Tax=Batrachochytrium dendrobatidis (strain JEL423) TaxID=403673 RepID=A0A177W8A5_BATDL|nr:hypothetical protein BDEG_20083 [Batrachochytrium dendrobatidis JEL423]
MNLFKRAPSAQLGENLPHLDVHASPANSPLSMEQQPLLNPSLQPHSPHSPAAASIMLQTAENILPRTSAFTFPHTEVLSMRGSVIPSISPLCIALTLWAALCSFWEGRRMWGNMITHLRNLSRLITISVHGPDTPCTRLKKHAATNLLLAFAVATKHHLRDEHGVYYEDLHHLLVHIPEYAPGAAHPTVVNLPLEISRQISLFVQFSKTSDWTDVPTANAMQAAIAGLLDCLGNLERIGNSPIPMAYLIHLKQTLFLYLLSLPFQLVSTMGWSTVVAVAAASFTLLGIEAIGGEIENPFGYDNNDLKLDKFCVEIKRELREMIIRAPAAHNQDIPNWTRPVDLEDRRSFVASD